MEIRLKEGDGLSCEISGAVEKALIKLQTDQGETPWMGIEALKKAWRILAPIAGQPLEITPPPVPKLSYPPGMRAAEGERFEPLFEGPAAQPSVQPRTPQAKLTSGEIKMLEDFQNQLVDLKENPIPMREGVAADGVSEADLRRLIGDHQNRFRDPFALYPVLRHHLGMDRERFKAIIEMNSRGM